MASQGGGHRRLRAGIDLGTGTIEISAQLIEGDATLADAKIAPICLRKPYSPLIEQVAIAYGNGEVIYGTDDVEKAIDADASLQDEVLQMWKLSLHPEFADLEEVKHVKKTLGALKDRGAIQDFMGDQLRCIIRDVRNHFKSREQFNSPEINADKDAEYWENIPLELQISVPSMWGAFEKGVVRNAAWNAVGEDNTNSRVQLRDEPLCVGAVYMLALVEAGHINEGQSLVIIDCGQGTLDVATVMLLRAPSHGVLMQLRRVGDSMGNRAGSHFINILAWIWICSGRCQQVQNVDSCSEQLDITRTEFQRQFNRGVNSMKEAIQNNPRHDFSVTIYSSSGEYIPGRLFRIVIDLPRDLIASWYKMWTDEAANLVTAHLNESGAEQHRCAILTGGGCKSVVFEERMAAALAPFNVPIGRTGVCDSPCSRGALLQHYFEEDQLPAAGNFYISREEVYDASVHTEAEAEDRVKASAQDPDLDVVENRLTRIMRYDNHGVYDNGKIPLRFLVDFDPDFGIRCHVDLFFSEEEYADHSPLEGIDGRLRAGIEPFPLAFVDVDDLAKEHFRVVQRGKNGNKHYDLRTFVQIDRNDDRVEMTIWAMKHNYRFPGEIGGRSFTQKMVLWEKRQEVWNKSFSHFVRDTSGSTESQHAGLKRKINVPQKASSKPKARRTGTYFP